ncbi:site-specific integrase [Vibrio parahaemolyticus]|uniref:site-specific integrase n=1 Tax=Vibrio parahaemolyticus TaxID=670 RepID=UPI0003F7E2BC|nr:site-specific integrase [Vibrio parahaemolyticus]EIF8962036.1 site-specific integrase [Vibrio parahaemolyticus]
MRYLKITKHGTWQFRFQIPPRYRHLFSDASEVKKSLGSCDKEQAIIDSLKLELDIRHAIKTNTKHTSINKISTIQPENAQKTPKPKELQPRLDPFYCLKQYSESKRGLISDKAIEMSHAKISTILSLLLKNQITDIRRLESDMVRRLLSQYPVNAKKMPQFKGMDNLKIIEVNTKLNLPTLSDQSVKDYIQKASSFFEWCIRMELTDINPFKAMRFKKTRRDSEAKNAYTNDDLVKIFSTEIHKHKIYKHAHYYWLPLLGYFTGARLNELCQLYAADIYKKEDIWVIHIDDRFEGQKLKNASSRRIIPIHDKLIDLGFIEYIQSIAHTRIFPELKNSRDGFGSAPSKWFGRFKSKLGFKKGYDFHSFRHTAATQFKRKEVSSVMAGEILGHAQNNITYDRYGKDLELIVLKTVINKIDANVLGK